jgi:hypothetical protein
MECSVKRNQMGTAQESLGKESSYMDGVSEVANII